MQNKRAVVDQWELPRKLLELIESGFWPTNENANSQNLRPLIAEEKVKSFAPEESTIWFDPPPFVAISTLVERKEEFWTLEEANPKGISFEHSVVIGDFGLGSDAPIILDYKVNPQNPEVKRLRWGKKKSENRWIKAARDFDHFCELLELPVSTSTKAQQVASRNLDKPVS